MSKRGYKPLKKSWLVLPVLLAGLNGPTFGQSMPDWKSYTQTHDMKDIVSSLEVAAWLGKKVDTSQLGVNGGVATLNSSGQVIQPVAGSVANAPADATGNTVASISEMAQNAIPSSQKGAANGVPEYDANKNLILTHAVYGPPVAGDTLGIGYYSFIRPNPRISGSISVDGLSPSIHLDGVLSNTQFDIWQDKYGNAEFSTGASSSVFDFYIPSGKLNIHGVNPSSPSQVNLYGYGYTNPASMWADADMDLNISTANTGNNLNLYASKAIILHSNTVMPVGTPSSSDTCTHGQIESDDTFIYVCSSAGSWKKTALGAM